MVLNDGISPYTDLEPIGDHTFPCLGAKAAFNSQTISISRGRDFRTNTSDLAACLTNFVEENANRSSVSVVAAIDDLFIPNSEAEFEEYLWDVLNKLHASDHAAWDPAYSSNTADVNFKFSYAGRAFYVVGLSPCSSRHSRRFPKPVLIFNPVWQFESLRRHGQLELMIEKIRERDLRLQGSVNPNLKYEGVLSDAIQYSGREVDAEWLCPFLRK